MTSSTNPFELTPEEEEVLDMIEEEEQYGIKKMDPEKALEMLDKRRAYLRAELHTAFKSLEECSRPEDLGAIACETQRLSEEITETERRICEYQLMKEGKN